MTRDGFVLPALLGTLLVIGVISFAMSLVATLESLSARSAAGAVEARALVDGALALALASVREQAAAGGLPDLDLPTTVTYGPWEALGIDAVATLSKAVTDGTSSGGPEAGTTETGGVATTETAPTAAAGSTYRLAAEVTTDRARAVGELVFRLEPELTVLERRRP